MKLKASTEYGIRIVMYLALNRGICSSKDIADAVAVPRDYLIQLAQLLRNAGIVDARSGKNGGYSLAKEPSEITLFQVVDCIDEGIRHDKDAARGSAKSDKGLMDKMRKAFDATLASYEAFLNCLTIAELTQCIQGNNSIDKLLSTAFLREGKRLSNA